MHLSTELIIERVKNEYDENGLIVAVVYAFAYGVYHWKEWTQ